MADPIDPIVDVGWLQEHLDEVVLCEAGSGISGGANLEDHRAGHLPGARLMSVDDDLAGAPGPGVGRHPLPSPEELATRLGALGIANDAVVVAYDRSGGAFAGRLVWMLRAIGQPAGLLDGGLAAWDRPLEAGALEARPIERRPVPWPAGATADAAEVAAHIEAGGVVVDSRAAERYRGEVEPIDAVAGHIPGAINLPFAGNLADGCFRPVDELAQRFAEVVADRDPIVYCGSGVTACHNALAVEHATGVRPRLYVGSWSGWSTDPERPAATGPEERPRTT